MESSAAQRSLVRPLGRRLRDLADLRPGVPVLSLYIDLDPARFGTQPARASAYTSVLDEARRRIEACDTVFTTSVQPAMTPRRSFMSQRMATTQRPSNGPPIHHGICE